MRILVGTLFSGENEFAECLQGLRRQSYDRWEHFVIDGLPKQEAHQQLYGTFMRRAAEFDLFLKVDADMVIEKQDLFSGIVYAFRRREWMRNLQILVWDFFSDRLINGMHAYRSCVKWPDRDEDVFTDLCPVGPDEVLCDTRRLAPAAMHCKNPSSFQAFRFGIHKGVKLRAAIDRNIEEQIISHADNIELTWRHFLRTSDRRLGLASAAAALALRGEFQPHDVCCDGASEVRHLRRYDGCDSDELKQIVCELRQQDGTSLPCIPRRYLQKYAWRWPGIQRALAWGATIKKRLRPTARVNRVS